jgi:spore coat protein SA
MNIAIISPGPFSVPPVMGSSVEHDIDEVSKHFGPDHHVTIYTRTCPTYPESSKEENREFIRVSYDGASPYLQEVIRELRKRRKPDVILVENRPHYVLPLRRHFPSTPIVVNMHSHVYASKALIRPEKMQRISRLADGFITNSEYLRQYFIRHHRIPEHKVHAVHLGVDVTPYQLAKLRYSVRKLRKSLGLKSNHRVLFYAGRLMREKGVHVLIKAFREICEKDPYARLVIVGGTGYGSNRLNRYVKELHELAEPLGDKVTFVKFVPSAEMPLWYQIGDIVATPSLWQEPFCRVNLEAMASGKPVISTTRGGIAEVVHHQSSGFLIPPAEWEKQLPLLWNILWKIPNVRQELGRQAFFRAKEFSWYATAQGYLQVFEPLVQKRSPKSVPLRKIS